ncbi:arylacetamide deacetylase-like [Tenrec ecaudatus]|uniref:arylacetamide deacetylase-like n=1 Tax=Tenrec ecaudatus TaxID=94439 RepID=UPI003F592D73
MGKKSFYVLIVGVLVAYYVYIPLPENFEEPWKMMWMNTQTKTFAYLAAFLELLGIKHFMDSLMIAMSIREVPPVSDENVTVTDTTFNDIPVRVFVPTRKSKELRRAVFYIHGGGWCLGSAALYYYDMVSRWTADRLDAVLISTDYRLAPKYHFPIQFEDVYSALRWFLRKEVLEQYGVNPERIAISGDSAGGNLAAATVQQLLDDPDVKIKIKIQSLIYPALQILDMNTPSYQENAHAPILSKSLMVRFWSEYITKDRSLEKAMLLNQHVSVGSSHLFRFVNWSSLLPEKFKKGYVYKNKMYGSSELTKKYPALLDVKVSPLLADDSKLRNLPLTYILTCQHDVLRDDGLMYVTRLRSVGVQVTHHHVEAGFHGMFSFIEFKMSSRIINQYLSWLNNNL